MQPSFAKLHRSYPPSQQKRQICNSPGGYRLLFSFFFVFGMDFHHGSARPPWERLAEGTGPHKGAQDSSHESETDASKCRSHYFQFANSPSRYRKIHHPLYCLRRRAGAAVNLKEWKRGRGWWGGCLGARSFFFFWDHQVFYLRM